MSAIIYLWAILKSPTEKLSFLFHEKCRALPARHFCDPQSKPRRYEQDEERAERCEGVLNNYNERYTIFNINGRKEGFLPPARHNLRIPAPQQGELPRLYFRGRLNIAARGAGHSTHEKCRARPARHLSCPHLKTPQIRARQGACGTVRGSLHRRK